MHTVQHLINQTMIRMFDCGRNFSDHIEKKKSKLDYHFGRELTEEELRELESRVNEVIEKNLEVIEESITKEEAFDKYNLDRLPAGSEASLKVAKIGDYDACLCKGGHVKNTSEIGQARIVSGRYNDGVLRIIYKLTI